jgi:hypothetical protein
MIHVADCRQDFVATCKRGQLNLGIALCDRYSMRAGHGGPRLCGALRTERLRALVRLRWHNVRLLGRSSYNLPVASVGGISAVGWVAWRDTARAGF